MAKTNPETGLTTAEQRIMRTKLEPFSGGTPRICLLQIKKLETFSEETEAQRKAIEDELRVDYEDYNEAEQGARPPGTDPKADVRVCGIGGCTLRLFQCVDGGDIQNGNCKAADYCLKERFEAVKGTDTVQEGQKLYKDIINTCDRAIGGGMSSNFCPKLDCGLSAGLSQDQVSGTHGDCPVENLTQLEGIDQ